MNANLTEKSDSSLKYLLTVELCSIIYARDTLELKYCEGMLYDYFRWDPVNQGDFKNEFQKMSGKPRRCLLFDCRDHRVVSSSQGGGTGLSRRGRGHCREAPKHGQQDGDRDGRLYRRPASSPWCS